MIYGVYVSMCVCAHKCKHTLSSPPSLLATQRDVGKEKGWRQED